jgi:DNA (cytosine-5)-methyltransferase 1
MTPLANHSGLLVDLFSGCGGFSLGAHSAGFHVATAFDNDPILSSSYANNFSATRLLIRDVSKLTGKELLATVDGRIHGIFGGPPCQGFSDIGRRDPADPRRQLVDHFFRIVAAVGPAFFVMENVRGLAYSDASYVLNRALQRVTDRYSILGPCVLDASEFGAATKRARIFVIGVHKDHGDPVTADDIAALRRPAATVQAAIGDLEGAIEEGEREGFDTWRITQVGRPFEYARRLRSSDGRFTGHRPTAHSKAVIKRFDKVAQGGIDEIGRHPRLSWDGQCPTLRAGTGSDRGSYQSVRPIHPDHPRVISVREAARIQGFPDRHIFHPTVWHSFRMIGNSVSPIMAEAIFRAIASRVHVVARPKVSTGRLNGSFDARAPFLADVPGDIKKYDGRDSRTPRGACSRATF